MKRFFQFLTVCLMALAVFSPMSQAMTEKDGLLDFSRHKCGRSFMDMNSSRSSLDGSMLANDQNTDADTAIIPCASPVTVMVGSGVSYTNGGYFPLNTYYRYSYTQQIIPASQLGEGAQNYVELAFQYFYFDASTRNVDIYLANVPNSLNLSTDWILPDSSLGIVFTLVYSGEVTFNNMGEGNWVAIPFSQAFAYDGTSNLLVTVLDHTGSYASDIDKFYTHEDQYTTNMSRYAYQDWGTFDPAAPSHPGTAASTVNNMRLIYCDNNGCARPDTPMVSNITQHSVQVSWAPAGTETSWEVSYRNLDSTVWTNAGTASTPNFTLSGLATSSNYQVRVRAVCGTDNYSLWSDPASFRTECGDIVDLPYYEDFEDPNDLYVVEYGNSYIYCWNRYTSDDNHKVLIPNNAQAHGGLHFLDFNWTPGCYNMAIMPAVDTSINFHNLMLHFYACRTGATGTMEVGVMTDETNPTTFVPIDTLDFSAFNFYEYSEQIIFFGDYTGSGRHIAFRASNAVESGFLVDDVSLMMVPSCVHPVHLHAYDVTETGVTLGWTEMGNATGWNIEYGPEGFTPGQGEGTVLSVTTNFYTVQDLIPTVTYDFYVQANCGSEWSEPVSVVIGQFVMSANGSDTLSVCKMLVYDDGGPDANYSNNCNSMLVLYPSTPGAALMVTGMASMENNWEYLHIYDGVGTSGTELLSITGNIYNINVVSISGPITILFTSDDFVNSYFGFELLVQCINCVPPHGLEATNITSHSATLNWSGSVGSGTGNYLVHVYGADTTVTHVQDLFMNLNNLAANTTYTFAVQSICGADTSDMSSPFSFNTLAIPAQLPYNADFEQANDNLQWGFVNGTQVNQWYIGVPLYGISGVNNTPGGVNGLYVSDNGGASNTYHGVPSKVYAYRDILVPNGVTELRLTFDWKSMGASERNDYLRVYWINPSDVSLTAGSNLPVVNGVLYDFAAQPGYDGTSESQHWLSRQNTWQHQEMFITSDQFAELGDGSRVFRLVFSWRNINNSSNPPAAVDNISLNMVTCATPDNVVITNVTSNSAIVSWNGNADTYRVTVSSDSTTVIYTTTTNSLTLSGLSDNANYSVSVKAFCVSDSSMPSQTVSFSTYCGAVSQLPYTEDFESYVVLNDGTVGNESHFIDCWLRYTTQLPHVPYYSNAWWHGSSYGVLDFNYTAAGYNIAVTPMFDGSIPLDTLLVTFSAYKNGNKGHFEIGTMTDPLDPSTYEPYDTIDFLASGTWELKHVLMNNYSGSGQYIAFRSVDAVQTSYLLDDLVIDVAPECLYPMNPVVSDIASTTATVSWNGNSDEYVLEYGMIGFTPGSGTTVTVSNTTYYELTNLNPTTAYTIYIYSDCGSGGLSSPAQVSFMTTMVVTGLPYSTDFFADQSWMLNNGACQNYWTMGLSTSGQPALFVTHDGNAEGYLVTASSTVMAEKLFQMPSADSVHVEFDVKIGGEASWDYMKAFLTPGDEVFTPGINQNVQSGINYNDYALDFSQYKQQTGYFAQPYMLNVTHGNTIHVSMNVANPEPNGVGKFVFLWRNDNTLGTQPGAVVSNFSITEVGSTPLETLTVTTNAATGIGPTNAMLNATITNPDNVVVTARGFEWKRSDDDTYMQVAGFGGGNAFVATLTGLTPNTEYTYRAFIIYNGVAVFGSEMTFTTVEHLVGTCDVPANITITNITRESFTVSWDNNTDVMGWNVRYRTVNGGINSVIATTNTIVIDGLTPETDYVFQVQTVCDDDEISEWSDLLTVTTLPDGLPTYLASRITLYPNPAREYVDVRVDENMQVSLLEVYDVYGKLITTVDVETMSISSLRTSRIDVSALAGGMYYVRVTTDQGVVTKPFVKNR